MPSDATQQDSRIATRIDFLAIGHVTHDRVGGRIRLGGAALYSALTATRMGKRAGIVTSYGKDFAGRNVLDGILTMVQPAEQTTTFENVYTPTKERIQHVYQTAAVLAPDCIPPSWRRTRIVYLCPVLHEVPLQMVELFSSESLIGIAPQGFFRSWDKTGHIHPRRWEGYEQILRRATVVIVSENDITGNEDIVKHFRRLAKIVIVTRAEKGATIFSGRSELNVGAYPASEIEPTGAGDCFGASFLIRYDESRDIREAARFASCVGAFVVEKEGIKGIPSLDDVLNRMNRYSLAIPTVKKRHT